MSASCSLKEFSEWDFAGAEDAFRQAIRCIQTMRGLYGAGPAFDESTPIRQSPAWGRTRLEYGKPRSPWLDRGSSMRPRNCLEWRMGGRRLGFGRRSNLVMPARVEAADPVVRHREVVIDWVRRLDRRLPTVELLDEPIALMHPRTQRQVPRAARVAPRASGVATSPGRGTLFLR